MNFTKRALGLILAAAMMLTAFTGCGAAPKAEAGALFKPGTFTGEGQGFGGAIQVEVQVDANKILDIKVLPHKETQGVSDAAFNTIPKKIIENQSVAVDTVSGCTMSSKGILEAVKAALAQTATDMSKLEKKVEAVVSGETIKKEADVVIIGAGGAGMSAAVEALKAGSSVIVVEKMPSVGGNTILAGSAYNAADPELQKTHEMSASELKRIEDIIALEPKNDMMKSWQETLKKEIGEYKAAKSTYLFDSPSLHKLQTYMDGDYVGDTEIINVFGDKALEGIKFLSGLGTEWVDGINAAVGATWMRSHTPTTKYGAKGAGFVMPQVEYAEKNGAEIMLNSKAEELMMDGGKCVGVKGKTTEGQPFEITAKKNVILATGGFGANVEMRQKYNKHWPTLDASIQTTNHVGATGDGIVMAEAVGANLVGMEWIQMLPTYGKGVFTAYIENQFYINKEGKRFVKEDGRRDELSKAVLEQTDAQIYIISDANTVKDGVTVNAVKVDEQMVGNGFVFKADTLEDLAKQINVPYEALKASVDEFNNSIKTGKDPFGRTVFDQAFGKAPFYAGLTNPMVHHTMGGVQINTQTQVLDQKGNVIPGLYAAGEVTGGVHGANRLGGNAIADITVFGRIAGQNASK